MKFGEDFNASVPTDGDFVRSPNKRQMATELRDLKFRIVDFFGCFGTPQGTLGFDKPSESGGLALF